MKKKLVLAVLALLLAALVVGAFVLGRKSEPPIANAGTSQNAVEKQVSLTYDGKEYPIKPHIQTVLLIGTDSTQKYQKEENKLQDYYNYNQADVLMLLVLDKDANTARIIQLNRDTMSHVPWLDVLGNYGGREFKQICLAYNYGDGGEKSCKNTVDAVSYLLFDAPIQSYIQIPMTAVGVLNDLVGGVPVTITEDLTVIDPSFTQGANVHLKGAQAEQFLRVRAALEDDTNASRMRRQRDYMDSFQICARDAFRANPDFSLKLVEVLGEFMQSNLTAQQLSELTQWLSEAQVLPICTPEGELVLGERYYEFYVDAQSLWNVVKEAYCE